MKFLTFLTLAVQIFFVNFIYSQDTTYDAKGFENIPLQKESILSDKYPVILDDKALFYINSSLGPFSPKERAETISKRLVDLKNNFFPDKLIVIRGETSLDIVYENRVIISITDKDAENANLSKEKIAENYKNIILQTIIPETNYTIINNPKDIYNIFVENKSLLINIGKSLSITVIALIFILCITLGLKKINSLLKSKLFAKLKSIEVNGKIIISKVQILSIFNVIYFVVKYGAIIAVLYSYYYVIGFVFPSVKNSFLFDFIKGLLLSGITVIVSSFIIKSFYNGINLIDKSLEKWRGNIIKSLKIKNINILSENQAVKLIKSVLFILKIGVISILLYITIPIIFSYFKFTSNWANVLLGYIISPFKNMGKSILAFIPNLINIIIVFFVTKFVINIVKDFFEQIAKGELSIKGFYKEWARPTFKLARGFLIVFAFTIIFPLLPGSDSEIFRGVSIIMGLVFSIGSTSIIANLVSGLVLTYTNAFKIGDRVKIGETMGDIVEKTLLVTRIETTKNVIITIPNSIVLNNHMINYTTSSSQDENGLILHTTITLGYDIPWKKIHETLIAAALNTENVKKDPKPFVLQTALNDFNVSYELNCYTVKPGAMAATYSSLHQNIQDKCNEAGIEILSPTYSALRDGNCSTIPEQYRSNEKSEEYKPPYFALGIVETLEKVGKKINGDKTNP